MSPPVHHPVIVTDGGPWVEHDMACAVCQTNKAILDMNHWTFGPCDSCRRDGWRLKRRGLVWAWWHFGVCRRL